MKSTYAFIGGCWDHLPSCDAELMEQGERDDASAILGTPRNLFDGDFVRRKVMLSDLLSCVGLDDVDQRC